MASKKARKVVKVASRSFVLILILIGLYFLIKPLAQEDYRIKGLIERGRSLDFEIEKLNVDIKELKTELESAKHDAGIEKRVRETMQMVRQGEKIYICTDTDGLNIAARSDEILKKATPMTKKNPFAIIWDWIISLFR